jgi:hypothetical protein
LGSKPLSSPSETSTQAISSRQSSEHPALADSVTHPKTCPAPSVSDLIPRNGPAVVPFETSLPKDEIDFAELEDGTLVEAIEDPNNPASSTFVVFSNGTVQFAEKMERADRVLVPVRREHGIFKHVRLPRGTQPCACASLLGGVGALILACVDVSLDDASLIAAFVVSTWFIESLTVAPYLALVGPPRSGKTTLLQVLNLICRQPLLTADITSAAFYEVYEKLSPTLLVDETLTAGNQRELFHLLKTGTTRGAVTLRKGRQPVKAFGPKVISCTELPKDPALNSRCVIIPMQETSRTNLAKPMDKKSLDKADVLQKQLLHHRLENYRSLSLPKVEGDERLHSRTRDLYQALALPIGSNAEFCEYLVRLFETQQEINREPLSPACAAVLGFLYEWIHLNLKEGKCAQKDLTVGINFNLERLQETFRLNAHEVGRALTSLGFTNRKRTNAGFILWLDLRTRKRIHNLAHDYAIDQGDQFQEEDFRSGCELCQNPRGPKPASAEMKGDSGIESKQ